ncbi:MAG: rane-bound lytic murein transglycosylase, partial [Bacteroidota bacterium]|nr:rane-bound lytic murein transglycosylase [Bacteroidota bacterium]
MKATHRLIFSTIVACSLAMQPICSQTTKQAKDTIDDKSIVVPESMNKDLSDLLHDWQIDFSSFQNDCQQGSNVIFNDSIYIRRLHNMPSFMELSYNHVVRSYIDMYADRKRSQVAYMLALGDYYFPMFEQMLDKYELPLELKYLPVIESALNPVAVSRVGATGLWQFMLKTGKGYGLEINSLVDERRDPIKSSEAAARYLKDLYTIYQDWNLVIAAYN